MLAVPGLVWPHFATFLFQPHAWATPLLASAYFWSIAALWGALALDWLAAHHRTERHPWPAGSDASAGVMALRSR
jgi:hypothetical protein